ncbi:MAG TPA: hypothetical protein VGL72_26725 [Bryobacteraceae bacterium]|jgi:hypothetical protein
MNGCEEVRDILLSVARHEPVSAPGQRFLREHVDICPDCRRDLANQRMLTAGLSALAVETPAAPPEALRSTLLAEFSKQQKIVPIRRPLIKLAILAAAAAAVLIVLSIATERRTTPVAPPTPAKPQQIVQAPSPARPAPVVTTAKAVQAPRPKFVPRPKPKPVQPADEAPEVATDFIAIPYAEPLRPEERTDVYRIEMPRANMAVFGLPVIGGRLDSRVKADIVTGEDGVVRAVRFIR